MSEEPNAKRQKVNGIYESTLSNVEKHFLNLSGRNLCYSPKEKIGVIEVNSFPVLGKLTALRFIEWVQQNPGGVISLPTGKTPEHFIKWVTHYLKTWDSEETKNDLRTYQIDVNIKPDMWSLHFVQIDDFYPIDPTQHNSFLHYVNLYYIEGFGLDRKKCLLINSWTLGCPSDKNAADIFPNGEVDLSLRYRQPKNHKEQLKQSVINSIDQFCTDYEKKIQELGGIGFFYGGIGPDGHIAFNIRGSDHFSTTRLTPTNYETQAAAAGDLGGIELARKTLVITIGLKTITANKNVVAIIAAAGEAKAKVVSSTIQNEANNAYPGSALHGLANSRFYLTQGAASLLEERVFEDFVKQDLTGLSLKQKHRFIIDLSLQEKKRILELTKEDLQNNRFANVIIKNLKNEEEIQGFLKSVEDELKRKIETSMTRMTSNQSISNATNFMHTAPHHDDIELGYLPYVVHLLRPKENKHTFNYMTSGFNSVTNEFVIGLLENLKHALKKKYFADLLSSGYFREDTKKGYADVHRVLDGVAARDDHIEKEGITRRVARMIIHLFNEHTIGQLQVRCDDMLHYFKSRYPGQKDTQEYQLFKGMIREMESDLMWGYFGFQEFVNHLRLGFYKGEYFTENPTVQRDAQPILELLNKQNPDVVSVAFDPEGSGPDTHYKVMQSVCQALKLYKQQGKGDHIKVWGYRNVWYRFHPSDADLMIPVSLNSMAILDDSFNHCFMSQRSASFPAPEYDGPFSRFAQKIQAEQLQMLKICLGKEYFEKGDSHLLKRTHGLCFLVVMSLEEFFSASRDLELSVGPH